MGHICRFVLATVDKDKTNEILQTINNTAEKIKYYLKHAKERFIIFTQMNGETPNLWLGKFIREVCKPNGERYPGRTLYAIACGLNRHLQEACEVPLSILDKNETR
jgi:hypothetical protein